MPADIDQDKLNAVPLLGPAGSAAAYRRSMLDELGGYPADYFLYYEDLEVALRARRRGWGCAWLDDALVTHDHVSGAAARKLYYLIRARTLFRLRNWPRQGGRGGAWIESGASWTRALVAGRFAEARQARADALRIHHASPVDYNRVDGPLDNAWFPSGAWRLSRILGR